MNITDKYKDKINESQKKNAEYQEINLKLTTELNNISQIKEIAKDTNDVEIQAEVDKLREYQNQIEKLRLKNDNDIKENINIVKSYISDLNNIKNKLEKNIRLIENSTNSFLIEKKTYVQKLYNKCNNIESILNKADGIIKSNSKIFNMQINNILNKADTAINEMSNLNLFDYKTEKNFDGFNLGINPYNEEASLVKGDNFNEYINMITNIDDYKFVEYDCEKQVLLKDNLIEGINIYKDEFNKETFWNMHKTDGTSKSFVKIAEQIPIVQSMLDNGTSFSDLENNEEYCNCTNIYFDNNSAQRLKVRKCGDFYIFNGNGRHRYLAARMANTEVPVFVTGEYELR